MGWRWLPVVAAVLVAAVLAAADRLALAAEARGWLYWHRRPASAGNGTVPVWDW